MIFPALLKTLASCQERIEDCGTLVTGSSSQDLRDEGVTNEITQCKKSAEIFLTGFLFFNLQLYGSSNFYFKQVHCIFSELKNCSKKDLDSKRCQCLEAMNESNIAQIKVD